MVHRSSPEWFQSVPTRFRGQSIARQVRSEAMELLASFVLTDLMLFILASIPRVMSRVALNRPVIITV